MVKGYHNEMYAYKFQKYININNKKAFKMSEVK